MVVAAWIALLVASLVIFVQAGLSLFLMLYTWENPQRLAASSGPEAFLPPRLSFSILLPARHEEAVIFQTIKRIWAADYPRELMEIVVICHASDDGTIDEAQRAIREIGSHRVRVETFSDGPINKPHGLNVGLQRTSNDVVTIFDAEDDVDPDVFNMVNTVMLEEKVGVVQAGIQLMNFRDHWFSVHNCLEYFFYFKSRLHFHAKVGMIPLGGNTVFILRTLMNHLGGWDENCLTEDADIGLRLSAMGERIRVVYDAQRVTREETPDSVAAFLRQRTRWNQGFLQVLRKGSWRSLSTRSQKALALYTMIYPVFHAAVTMLWPLVLIAVVVMKVPILIALASFLPMYALLLQLAVNLAGLYVFAGEYGLKVPIREPISLAASFLPFQFLLGCSALRAVYREARGQNNWEKTAHLGAHRRPEIALPADYELLLEETLGHLGVERGSVMVLDDSGRTFSIGASRGLSADVVDSAKVDIGEGVVGWVARTDSPVLINGHEVPTDLRVRLSQPDLRSSIVVPFKQEDAVAVLSLSSRTRELDEESLRWASRRVNTLFPTQTVRSGAPVAEESEGVLAGREATVLPLRSNGGPAHGAIEALSTMRSDKGETPILTAPDRDRNDAMPSGGSPRRRLVALVLGSLVCLWAFFSLSNFVKDANELPSAPMVVPSKPSPNADGRLALREDVIRSVRGDAGGETAGLVATRSSDETDARETPDGWSSDRTAQVSAPSAVSSDDALAGSGELATSGAAPGENESGGCRDAGTECLIQLAMKKAPQAEYVGGRIEADGRDQERNVLYFEDPTVDPCESIELQGVANQGTEYLMVIAREDYYEESGAQTCVAGIALSWSNGGVHFG